MVLADYYRVVQFLIIIWTCDCSLGLPIACVITFQRSDWLLFSSPYISSTTLENMFSIFFSKYNVDI